MQHIPYLFPNSTPSKANTTAPAKPPTRTESGKPAPRGRSGPAPDIEDAPRKLGHVGQVARGDDGPLDRRQREARLRVQLGLKGHRRRRLARPAREGQRGRRVPAQEQLRVRRKRGARRAIGLAAAAAAAGGGGIERVRVCSAGAPACLTTPVTTNSNRVSPGRASRLRNSCGQCTPLALPSPVRARVPRA